MDFFNSYYMINIRAITDKYLLLNISNSSKKKNLVMLLNRKDYNFNLFELDKKIDIMRG